MATFDSLPLELKEKILLYIHDSDMVAVSRVSKEWRQYARFKRILQKELDKYYFLFIVWYFSPEERGVQHPVPDIADALRGGMDLFVFPITNENDLVFLLQHGVTNRSQVAALQKGKDWGIVLENSMNDPHDVNYFPNEWSNAQKKEKNRKAERRLKRPLGDTQTLIKRIKKFGKDGVRKYIAEISLPLVEEDCPYFAPYGTIGRKEFEEIKGPRFSDKKRMLNLLRGEHKVMVGYLYEHQWDVYYILPKNYVKIGRLRKKYINKIKDEECKGWVELSYRSLTKSLFIPRWGFQQQPAMEITPAQYQSDLKIYASYT